MATQNQQNVELKSVVTVIRCILQSAPKDGLTAIELNNDYTNMEGCCIPFHKLGYNSIDDMLKASGEFILKQTNNGRKFIQKESNHSAHINRFVQQQNKNKKNKKKNTVPIVRRPIHTTNSSSNLDKKKWHKSAYSDIYSHLPNRSTKKFVAASNASNGRKQYGTANPIPSLLSLQIEPPAEMNAHNRNNNNNNNKNINQTNPKRSQSNQHQQSHPSPLTQRNTNIQTMRPITKQSNSQSSQFNYNKNRIDTPKLSTASINQSIKFSDDRTAHGKNRSIDDLSISQSSIKSSVNSRLSKYPKITLDNNSMNDDGIDDVDFIKTIAPSSYDNIDFNQIDKNGYENALSTYCTLRCYDEPKYNYISLPKTKKVQCKLTINKIIYSTYPMDYDTDDVARNEVAKIAFQSIKDKELTEKSRKICMDTDVELGVKVLECITAYPNGVFEKKIPQLFEEKYNLSLPENWNHILIKYEEMFSISVSNDIRIIHPNMTSCSTPFDDIDTTTITKSTLAVKYVPNNLILPWNERHWNVFITNPTSTVEVYGRIIGPEYSGKMDSLLTDIELDLFQNRKIAETLKIDSIYLVLIAECYHRIRIEKIDLNENQAFCFYIDIGDQEWFSCNEIYECDKKFIDFPAQAICFSLFGLEDFAENPNAKQHVDEYLAGKSLIAEILTNELEYTKQMESNDLDPKIQIILYDTSSDDDIQLNPLILEKICEKTVAPQLERLKLNSVIISYINDSGDIYCQLTNSKSSLHYINKLIHQLTEGGSTLDFNQYRYVQSDVQNPIQNLYLIYDNDNDKWYRAAILPTKSVQNTKTIATKTYESMKCVDYGMIKCVAHENIYRLDLLSAALSKYPAQAILVRLNDVQNYNENIVARLRGLFHSNASVIIQVVQISTIPYVNIYKRLEPMNVMCKINDAIRMEQELENSADLLLDANDSFHSSFSSSSASKAIVKMNGKENDTLTIYPKPSMDGYFNIVVTMASNPINFIIRPHAKENEFKNMMLILQSHCIRCNDRISEESIRIGQCYAGLNKDNCWYRVIVKQVMPANMIIVYNCDYGDIAMLKLGDLRPLPKYCFNLPQLAISAKLHGIEPKNRDWCTDDCTRFQQLTVGKQFASLIKLIKNTDEQKYELEIVVIDVSTDEDVCLNQLLIDECRTDQ